MDEQTLKLLQQCAEEMDKQPIPVDNRYIYIDGEWREIKEDG